MGNRKQNFVHNVISVRISDEELAELKNLMGVSRKTVSALLRDALSLFREKYHNGQVTPLSNPAAIGDQRP